MTDSHEESSEGVEEVEERHCKRENFVCFPELRDQAAKAHSQKSFTTTSGSWKLTILADRWYEWKGNET
jgi:hypothetical protein